MSEKESHFLRIYISVSNATKELVRKLDKEYMINKQGSHGYEIRRIDYIVEKYYGFINWKNKPCVFVTEVMLSLEEVIK